MWTTTPWTLTSNVGAAVHPELTYLKVKHKDEVYYVAKGAFTVQRLEEQFKRKEWVEGVPKLKTLEQHFKEKGGFEIVGEVKGSDLVGLPYEGPFDEMEAQGHPAGYPVDIAKVVLEQKWGPNEPARKVHRVVAWTLVGEAEGTGIVHIAPGCGKEDFQLGKEQGLVPIAPLDDSGVFLPGFGELSGKPVLDHATTDWILRTLQEKGVLFAVEKYPHNYPHCWRCKTELLFRLVDEWFINMKWRDEIIRAVEDPEVRFVPESVGGKARELDWLRNMGDWMISKKRFWGLALPIWVDEKTGDFEVIGSREELKERAVEGWEQFEKHSPHRPWIDLVKIRNPRNGNLMARIPDVGNPWLDAGIVPFSTMGYNSQREYWEKWFPADFITESFPGQFRNWFYAILAMSTMMAGKAPFRTLLGHALVRDEHGEEMHKSRGNAIPFHGAADEGYTLKGKDGKEHKHPPMSADLMRWMYGRQNPALNINFGPHIAEEIRSKFLMKLWNSYAFFSNYARLDEFDPAAPHVPMKDRPDIDRWILSDLQLLIKKAREAFESFNVMAFCLACEAFVDDKLSNWYVRRNRRRFWKSDKGTDKTAAYQTLYQVLLTLTRLCAPVIPFVTETMYQNLTSSGAPTPERSGARAPGPASVHHSEYPQADPTLIDEQLSTDMDALLRIVSLGSAARNVVKIKVRQPLAELKVQPGTDADRRAVERFADQICEELNLKAATLHDAAKGPLLSFDVKLNQKNAGPKFGPRLKEVQAALAKMDPAQVAQRVQAGQGVEFKLGEEPFTLEPTDLFVSPKVEPGFAGLADRGTFLLLDARITPELAKEGMAREVIRHVQQSRKDAGLNMEDRIALFLNGEGQLAEAIQAHRDYIANETLVGRWSNSAFGEEGFKAQVKIEGLALGIELKIAKVPEKG